MLTTIFLLCITVIVVRLLSFILCSVSTVWLRLLITPYHFHQKWKNRGGNHWKKERRLRATLFGMPTDQFCYFVLFTECPCIKLLLPWSEKSFVWEWDVDFSLPSCSKFNCHSQAAVCFAGENERCLGHVCITPPCMGVRDLYREMQWGRVKCFHTPPIAFLIKLITLPPSPQQHLIKKKRERNVPVTVSPK